MFVFRIRANVNRLRGDTSALKAIGPMNAAAIVSKIGGIRQFDSALRLQSYGGNVLI